MQTKKSFHYFICVSYWCLVSCRRLDVLWHPVSRSALFICLCLLILWCLCWKQKQMKWNLYVCLLFLDHIQGNSSSHNSCYSGLDARKKTAIATKGRGGGVKVLHTVSASDEIGSEQVDTSQSVRRVSFVLNTGATRSLTDGAESFLQRCVFFLLRWHIKLVSKWRLLCPYL